MLDLFLLLLGHSLTLVQAPNEVHNVEFVAVLPTPWQVIHPKIRSACFLLIVSIGINQFCSIMFYVAGYLKENQTLMLL